MNASAAHDPKFEQTARNTLIALFMVHFFASMDRYAFTVLLEPIKADLGATDTQMGLLSGLAFVICYVVFGIPFARLIDTGIRRTLVVATLAVWSAVTAAASLATSVLGMGLCRAALGSAEAGALPASLSMIADTYPKERRHQAVSIFQLGAGVSPIIGVPMVAVIADNYGWRFSMIALGVAGLVLAAVLFFVLKEPVRGRFDAPSDGTAMPSLGESFKVLGRNAGFVFHVLSHTVITCTTTIFVIWLNAYCVRVLKFSMTEAGLVTGASGALTIAGILGGGWICTRLIKAKQDDRWIAGFSGTVAFICAIGLVIMLWRPERSNFFIGFGITSLMVFARIAPAMTLSTDLAPPRMRGLSSSLTVGLSSLIGGGLAPVFMGRLSDSLAQSVGVAEGLRLAFLYTTVPCALFGALLAGISAMAMTSPQRPPGTLQAA